MTTSTVIARKAAAPSTTDFIPQMYFGVLSITAIGLLANTAVEAIERRFTRWRPAS